MMFETEKPIDSNRDGISSHAGRECREMKQIDRCICSVQYYRPPTPLPSEWEDDLKSIRDLGFNTIQLRVQ